MLQRTTLDAAYSSCIRLPFSTYELQFTLEWLKRCRAKNRDLQLGFLNSEYERGDTEEFMNDGVFVICSPHMLETGFVFFKCNAGKGIFGNQKAVYSSFIHDPHDNLLTVGAIFKRWEIALSSIGNVYRGSGFA